MLGNVKPFIPALSEDGKDRYSAFYCGLCRSLGKNHGIFSRFMLNYDMAFVAIVCDGLNGEQYKTEHRACFANPFRKKDILVQTKGTQLAADVLILLAYFKLLDNIYDEKLIKKAACAFLYPYFYIKYKVAAKRLPLLAQVLQTENINQQQYEKTSDNIDTLAMPTAVMVKNILLQCADGENNFALRQFGFSLGRVIYLLDALLDMEQDKKEDKFNIFNLKSTSRDQAKEECFMALGEMAYWYRQLDFKENKEITDNIIFISLARKIKFAGEEKEEENG